VSTPLATFLVAGFASLSSRRGSTSPAAVCEKEGDYSPAVLAVSAVRAACVIATDELATSASMPMSASDTSATTHTLRTASGEASAFSHAPNAFALDDTSSDGASLVGEFDDCDESHPWSVAAVQAAMSIAVGRMETINPNMYRLSEGDSVGEASDCEKDCDFIQAEVQDADFGLADSQLLFFHTLPS